MSLRICRRQAKPFCLYETLTERRYGTEYNIIYVCAYLMPRHYSYG